MDSSAFPDLENWLTERFGRKERESETVGSGSGRQAPPSSQDRAQFEHLSGQYAAKKEQVLKRWISLLTHDCLFSQFTDGILQDFLHLVPAHSASLLEIASGETHWFFRSVVGEGSEQLRHFQIPVGSGIVSQVLRSRQPRMVNDFREHPEHLRALSNAVGIKVLNMVALPLLIRSRVYGVIEVINRKETGPFTAMETQQLAELAKIAGQIIEVRLMLAWVKKEAQAA